MDWAGKELKYNNKSDWYNVNAKVDKGWFCICLNKEYNRTWGTWVVGKV